MDATMNYYQRLEKYGWTLYHAHTRWAWYQKREWVVMVPSTTFSEPIFMRNDKRMSR